MKYLLVVMMFLLSACGSSEVDVLWDDTVAVYLQDDLWERELSYDAANFLGVPLYYAYTQQDEDKIQDFDDMFARFSNAIESGEYNEEGSLYKLQFLYLASQHLVLSDQSDNWSDNKEHLLNYTIQTIVDYWQNIEVSQYGSSKKLQGMRERMSRKISGISFEKNYYTATTDHEMFELAIASDLYSICVKSHCEQFDVLEEIVAFSYDYFKYKSEFVDGRWLFEAGAWKDHGKYIYAGETEIVKNPKPVDGLLYDSSHGHRFGLWLTSLMRPYQDGSKELEFFTKVKKGFAKQFEELVLTKDSNDMPLVNNYLSGHNGPYEYRERGYADGSKAYGPYAMSGILFKSYYPFIQSDKLTQAYIDIETKQRSLVVETYHKPTASRTRHELIEKPNYYSNGMFDVFILMSSRIEVK